MALHTHTPEEQRRMMPKLRKKKPIQNANFDMEFVGRSVRGQTHNSAHKEEEKSSHNSSHKEEKQSGHKRRKLKVKTKEKKGKITTAGRRALKSGQFALPPSAQEKRRGIKGRFPIDTKARARNALTRGSQALKRGTISKAQFNTIAKNVNKAFPKITVSALGEKRKNK